MSENKHTQEPWSVFKHSWSESSIVAHGFDHGICGLDINHATEETQESDEALMDANARRIVACVNRLAQFTTEQIEDFGYDLFAEDRPRLVEAQNEIHLLKKQRDELLAALEDLLDFTPDPPDPNCSCHISPPCADCIDNGGTREAIETAKAAIASVKEKK